MVAYRQILLTECMLMSLRLLDSPNLAHSLAFSANTILIYPIADV